MAFFSERAPLGSAEGVSRAVSNIKKKIIGVLVPPDLVGCLWEAPGGRSGAEGRARASCGEEPEAREEPWPTGQERDRGREDLWAREEPEATKQPGFPSFRK